MKVKIFCESDEPTNKYGYCYYYASVAQWIEQWPPEPCAEVRFLSGAFFGRILWM